MNLKSGYPFWPVYNGLPENFPPLQQDLTCDVVVVGAGITGALIAHALADTGLSIIVVDKRDAGWGSTAASTALLQYEIDTELVDLAQRFGEKHAVMAYRACEQAIHALEEIAAGAGAVGFRRMSSLYFASRWHHAGRLRAESLLRKRHRFKLKLLERDALHELSGIRASLGLLTATAAQVDPYRLTYALLGKLRRNGVQVFDRSGMLGWTSGKREVELQMERNVILRCKHVVLAAGYEAQKYLPARVARNHSSYALVTEPIRDPGALKDMLVWESARPYLYMRTTDDGRVLVGGEDDRIDIAAKRDASVPRKSARLMRKLRKLMPHIPFEEGFAWAGTFAETADGLPFFGAHAKLDPRMNFAMAYGGNGITYSAVGAQILRARITGGKHPLMRFFSFERLA